MIKLPPLGQPLYRIEKSSNESITYTFDLTDVLNKNEVVTQVTTSLTARPRKTKLIEITAPQIEVGGAGNYQDTKINVSYNTNMGNTRSFSFIIRNYR